MIRKATINDVPKIQGLINLNAERNRVLPRSLNELYENVRDFVVCEENGDIIGCCAISVAWEDLAEIKSLAVVDSKQKQGIGSTMLKVCLDEAKVLGIATVFALTNEPTFFLKHGFTKVDKSKLPHKIWNECIRCVKFPNCDEEAVVIKINDK